MPLSYGKRLLFCLSLWSASCFAQSSVFDEMPDSMDEHAVMARAEAQRILASPVSETLPAKAQIDALQKYEQAAFAMGDGKVRVPVLDRLAILLAGTRRAGHYAALAWAEEFRYGNTTHALERGERLVGDSTYDVARRAGWSGMLADQYVLVGRWDKVRTHLGAADEFRRARDYKPDPTWAQMVIAHTEKPRGWLLRHDGDLDGAEKAMRRALAAADEAVELVRKRRSGSSDIESYYGAALRTRSAALNGLIHFLAGQGRHHEAEVLVVLGLSHARRESTAGVTIGHLIASRALIRLALRDYAGAADYAQQADRQYETVGVEANASRRLTAGLIRLQALFGLEQWAAADQLLAKLLQASADDPAARARFESSTLQAFNHVMNGRLQEARKLSEQGTRYRLREYGENAPSAVEAKAVRGMVYHASDSLRAAEADYRDVLRYVLAPETGFGDAEPAGLRGFYIPYAMDRYLNLIEAGYHANDRHAASGEHVASAFQIADRLRSRRVQQALIDSSARAVAATPALAALVRQEQDLRRQRRDQFAALVDALTQERETLKALEAKQQPPLLPAHRQALETQRAKQRQAIDDLREQLTNTATQRAAIQGSLGQTFPAYQSLVNPKPPRPEDLAGVLRDDEALLAVWPRRDSSFVWTVGKTGDARLHIAALGEARLRELVATHRAQLDDLSALGETFDTAAGRELYRLLIAPVETDLAAATTVIIVASGTLGKIPWATLISAGDGGKQPPGDVAWWVRSKALVQLPSAASLLALRRVSQLPLADEPFIGFGDPLFSPAKGKAPAAARVRSLPARMAGSDPLGGLTLTPLPETRDEILAIASALGADVTRTAFFGRDATRERALATDYSRTRVVAFATHGLSPGDLPQLSRPALALAIPTRPGDSQLLVLDDILTLRMNADWVVLSACNTAAGEGVGEEALSGLVRGFFFAGARSLLVTHWAVETLSAQYLVRASFENFAGKGAATRAASLRLAQLALIEGKADVAWQHPFFWAPYALTGDPGR